MNSYTANNNCFRTKERLLRLKFTYSTMIIKKRRMYGHCYPHQRQDGQKERLRYIQSSMNIRCVALAISYHIKTTYNCLCILFQIIM